ncbi:T9SS type A sorting domain-containing protein [Pontibacter ruber]|uniref:T9SS type A sorting domain-containing protein n=1 Tax=Pontibacter ruber TaxID=1343895 RepID=A0ABW5CTZ1_9BACT|nr:T9SS type A sorting domain-containing protein [Pontibacter ruber]
MSIPSVFRLIAMLALSLLLTLLSYFNVQAQDKTKEPKQMRVKIIWEADGKNVVTDTVLTVPDLQELRATLKDLELDTAVFRRLQENELRMLDKLETLQDGDTVHFRKIEPDRLHFADSVRSRAGEIRRRHASDAPRIIIERLNGKVDSALARGLENRLKVITDAKTGEKKVYRIDENGKEEELTRIMPKNKSGRNRAVIVVRKMNVQNITAADKQALKDAGAPVEVKPKEELKVEEISFYPNPNNGRFTLNFALDKKATTVVRIMDSKGNEVFVDTVEKLSGEYNREIDLGPFGPGIYYLQVAQGKRYHTKKIVVQ